MTNISGQELTTSQHDYIFTGLTLINRKIAVHEGDANRRLASESTSIVRIDERIIPSQYQKEFEKLIATIKKTLAVSSFSDREPYRIEGIRNATAVKYIKLLWEIEDTIKRR